MSWVTQQPHGRNKAGQLLVHATCSCGTQKIVTADNIKRGRSKSCGCHKVTHAQSRVGSAKKPSPTYVSWQSMKTRCLNPNSSDYPKYGGRGISVDTAWVSYEVFLADMGERPAGCTLDRKDVNGPYTKSNCRWATYKLQRANQRPHRRSVWVP